MYYLSKTKECISSNPTSGSKEFEKIRYIELEASRSWLSFKIALLLNFISSYMHIYLQKSRYWYLFSNKVIIRYLVHICICKFSWKNCFCKCLICLEKSWPYTDMYVHSML